MGGTTTLEEVNGTLHELVELVEYIQENMVTKEEAANFATKDDIKRLEGRIGALEKKVESLEDRVNKLEKRMNECFGNMFAHIDMIERDIAEIKARLEDLEKRTKEDNDAEARDIIRLQKRVSVLEIGFKRLKASAA